MKTMKKIVCALMTLVLLLSSVPAVFADEAKTIDQDAACSLTVWKFDYTNAKKDGVWDEDAFPSTGWQESYVENALVNTNRKGDTDSQNGNALGNGQTSKGYAIAGVEFTYLKAADIVTFENQGTTQVLYGFHKTDAADLLKAIGLESGANRCTEADSLDTDRYFYTSDTLNKALAQSLEANSTTVKNALETFIRNGGTAMAPTNEVGKTSAKDLPVGLYLLVETKVPEMVTSTTNPFFVSLPMTTVTGNDNSASQNGGAAWNYDVVVYPKQETGIPTLEKTVREAKADTGKNEGSASITDGFAHTATGSAGDTMEYQIISTLPTITSQATALSTYNFYDTLCEGLTYSKDAGVTIEFFTDAACTDKVATWSKDSEKFTVIYSEDGRHMTVDIAKAGLDEINGATANKNGKLYTGYSNYTARVTYSAVINSDKSFAYGEKGNENTVILTWKPEKTNWKGASIMELTYTMQGDYRLPNLIPPESPKVGKYGMLRHSYLRKHREGLYTGMLMKGNLNAHLEEVDREANRMLEQLTTQMAQEQSVTEELKAQDQMLWVQRMNNIRQTVHVFESAIDALSYATLELFEGRNWREDHLLSLAGVFVTKRENVVPVALSRYLADHPKIQVLRLHLDNDSIGRGAAAGIVGGLRNQYEIWDEPPRWGKDVNDQLKIRAGLKRKEEYSR